MKPSGGQGWVRRVGPGLAFVAVAVVLAFLFGEVVDVSPLVGGVVLGVIVANVGLTRPILTPGITFATKRLLRAGVVVLGLRLSFDQVRDLGVVGALWLSSPSWWPASSGSSCWPD